MYIIRATYLSQGEKIDANSLIQTNVKNSQTKIVLKSYLTLQEKELSKYRPTLFERKIHSAADRKQTVF